MATNQKFPDTQIVHAPVAYTQEQVDVIRRTIAPQGTTDDELSLFMMVCQKTGLDPFSRQIYFSERRAQVNGNWVVKKTPETTIDGFRVIAERSGQYKGQLGPYWCGDDGVWKDVWLVPNRFPAAAKVGILRGDFAEPIWGIALFDEYVQKTKDGQPNSMWSKMGANQLAKCAEALGLRKAFPRDLSGMYSREEMAQAEPPAPATADMAQQRIAEETQKAKPQHAALAPPPAPAGPVIPEEMQAIVASIKTPGGVASGLEILRKELLEAMPDTGGTVYTATLLKHNIKIGKPNPSSKVIAALLEMFEAAQEARAFKRDIVPDGISDADLPAELFPEGANYAESE